MENTHAQQPGSSAAPTCSASKYVAGFMFNSERTQVALIRKQKPEWQRNKLNGVGGKIEEWDTTSADAMKREFFEETGHATHAYEWLHFCTMGGNNCGGGEPFQVEFFVATGDLKKLRTMEAEAIEIVSLAEVSPLRSDMIENVPWLLPLALDYLKDGRPGHVEARYP